MIHSFEGNSANEVWLAAITAILEQGTEQPSRAGRTSELLHVGLQIRDPRQRWINSRREALNVGFALAEVIWILGGRNDSAFLNYFNRQLPKFAGDDATYYGAYGERLIRRFGVDQLHCAAEALRGNPSTRQVVLSIWDPRLDLPYSDGQPRAPDVPCNLVSMLKARGGYLDWTQVMRSNDVYRGLPHNIVQFTMLQEIVAGWANLRPGTYTHWSDSLHVYLNDSKLDPRAGRTEALPANNDSIVLSRSEFDSAWPQIERVANAVIDERCTGAELIRMLKESSLPTGWKNILWIVVAEGIRRRGTDPTEALSHQTNPMFATLWRNWANRIASR